MKKLLSLLCVLSLSAALLAGCSTAGDAGTSETPGSSSTPSDVTEMADPIDVNVMALKGPTAMGMVEFMNEADSGTITDNNYHFNITAATDEVSAALAQGTTDIAAEVIGMPDGSIGEQLQQAKIYLNTPDLFAWTLVIVLVSLIFEKVFLALLKRGERALERM